MRDSVPSASYSSVCNVLRQWNIPLIPTGRLYDIYIYIHSVEPAYSDVKLRAPQSTGQLLCQARCVIAQVHVLCTLNYSTCIIRSSSKV